MTTSLTAGAQGEVAVAALQHGDPIHIQPHDVFRHSSRPFPVACKEADVQVDWVCYREHVIVIVIWHIPACPEVCGSTAYDSDDSVQRVGEAA